jgi:hypothetical protein
MPAGLLALVIALIIIGVVLYLITLIPMDDTIKQIIRVVVIVAVLIWLVSVFFGGGSFGSWGLHSASPCPR